MLCLESKTKIYLIKNGVVVITLVFIYIVFRLNSNNTIAFLFLPIFIGIIGSQLVEGNSLTRGLTSISIPILAFPFVFVFGNDADLVVKLFINLFIIYMTVQIWEVFKLFILWFVKFFK